MIRHIVVMFIEPTSTDKQKDSLIEGLRELAATSNALAYSFGANLGLVPGSENAFGIVADFTDTESLQSYVESDEHARFASDMLGNIVTDAYSIQLEMAVE